MRIPSISELEFRVEEFQYFTESCRPRRLFMACFRDFEICQVESVLPSVRQQDLFQRTHLMLYPRALAFADVEPDPQWHAFGDLCGFADDLVVRPPDRRRHNGEPAENV